MGDVNYYKINCDKLEKWIGEIVAIRFKGGSVETGWLYHNEEGGYKLRLINYQWETYVCFRKDNVSRIVKYGDEFWKEIHR